MVALVVDPPEGLKSEIGMVSNFGAIDRRAGILLGIPAFRRGNRMQEFSTTDERGCSGQHMPLLCLLGWFVRNSDIRLVVSYASIAVRQPFANGGSICIANAQNHRDSRRISPKLLI
jgi:hypothetical protein